MQTTKKDDALLEACVAAFGAFIERDTPKTRAPLAAARARFREAAEAEFGAIADQQPQKDFGRPMTPVRPIEDDNRALDIGRSCVTCNYVVGAIHRGGDDETTIRH
jgi:hypothetical protein